MTVGADEMPSEQAVNNAQKREKRQKERARMGRKIKEGEEVGLKWRFRTRKMGKQ